MTTSPSDPRFVSYAIAADSLERFEDKTPPEWLIAQLRQLLTEAVAYSLTDSGQLAGCRGVCLAHCGYSQRGSRVTVPACSIMASCTAGQQLARYNDILQQWADLRARVRVARRHAGLTWAPEGRKKT